MISHHEVRLASSRDACRIAELSRLYVEEGLAWRWTPGRVLGRIRDPASNVPVVYEGGRPVAFGIMEYRSDEAHLLLLAVDEEHRRRGLGRSLLGWLEATALTAGIGAVYLETRAGNFGARAFYRRLGYKEVGVVPGYYQGCEAAIRLAKDLWAPA